MTAMLIRVLALLALILPASAHAEPCAPRDALVAHLADVYDERLQAFGLAPNGVFEIYASDESGSWTILISNPNGLSCIAASGQAFEAVRAEQDGDPL